MVGVLANPFYLASLACLHVLGMPNVWGIWAAIVVGLVVGTGIGKATEYYTSHSYTPKRW